jgi:hypothetical protein
VLEPTLITVAILLLSVALQSVLGFGLGMVSIPLMLCQGLPLSHAVFLGLAVSLLSSIAAGRKIGNDLPWRTSAVASGYRVVGLLPGLALAHATAHFSPAFLKAAIGLVIGLGVLAQGVKMLGRGTPLPEGTPPSAKLAPWAFLCSGVLTGWLGMGGPPLVFWQLTGRASARETRGFLFGVYLMTLPFQLAMMLCADPPGMASLFPILALSLPLCWWLTGASLAVGDRLSVTRLQWASLGFLAFLAVRSVADWALTLA